MKGSNPMSTAAPTNYPYAIPHEILLAFDPADMNQKAMECSKSLARRFGSHVTIAHVSQPVSPIVTPEGMYFEDLDRSAAAITDSQLDQAVEDLRASGLKADRAEHWGLVTEELQSLAREKSADLLVLGTHAPRGLDRLFFGSTAEDVADRSGWPVMIVGPNADMPSGAWAPKEVVCIVGQSREDVSAAVYGYHLSREVGAAFTLFSITDKGSEIANPVDSEVFFRSLADQLPGVNVSHEIPRREIRQGIAKDSVLRLLKALQPGAVVMAAEHAGPLHSHFHRDLLSDVVGEAKCPIIVVAKDDQRAQG
ncbi:universal stress protein [Terriglobus roseus]|uniref:Nucleotide-binding universal stress protein, UspA family n=1 Tax=Terriglobus roseus TaxID=392734 RepID=A0A1H4J861_9BACT|nr:universal stress protein [Terriglobus roseus]SEB42146.1 Nucleotide-binding universal stress protein, UspA family [Terriglobus roseus]